MYWEHFLWSKALKKNMLLTVCSENMPITNVSNFPVRLINRKKNLI